MKKLTILSLVAALSAFTLGSTAYAGVSKYQFNATVHARPGVLVDISSDVYESSGRPNGDTLLCVHGVVHDAASFKELALRLLDDTSVKRVIAIDLPGHGVSGFPYGPVPLLFGELTIEDEATVIRHMLGKYKDAGMQVSEVIAHSKGALDMFVCAQQLVNNGSSLAAKGVTKLKTLGASVTGNVFDPFLDEVPPGQDFPQGIQFVYGFMQNDPALGDFDALNSTYFQGFFFTRKSDGQVANGAWTTNQIDARGIMAIESFTVALQTLGTADMRPSVSAGLLAPANGTVTTFLYGAEDPFSDAGPQNALALYLTGRTKVVVITGNQSVHSEHVFKPGPVATALGH